MTQITREEFYTAVDAIMIQVVQQKHGVLNLSTETIDAAVEFYKIEKETIDGVDQIVFGTSRKTDDYIRLSLTPEAKYYNCENLLTFEDDGLMIRAGTYELVFCI